MKKISTVVFALLWISVSAFASEQTDLTGAITYKGDLVQPADATSRAEHRVEFYTRYKETVGAGVDTIIAPKSSYSLFRPYITATSGKLSAIAGYAADSKKTEHIFGGIWFTPSIGKFNIFLDMRNYIALNDSAFSYQDNFIEVAYPVTEKVTVGVNAIYDHYWNKKLDCLLVGPVAYFAVTKQVKLFARYSKEWAFSDQSTESADRFRLGVRFLF